MKLRAEVQSTTKLRISGLEKQTRGSQLSHAAVQLSENRFFKNGSDSVAGFCSPCHALRKIGAFFLFSFGLPCSTPCDLTPINVNLVANSKQLPKAQIKPEGRKPKKLREDDGDWQGLILQQSIYVVVVS
jgi:hypothetical protein